MKPFYECFDASFACRGSQWFKRISCPACDNYKIRSLCTIHVNPTLDRLKKVDRPMHCSKCGYKGVAADFWAVYADKETV